MILEEVLRELRDVESGYMLMHRPLAGKAADIIELLVDKTNYLEEKLKEEPVKLVTEILGGPQAETVREKAGQ